MSPMLLNPFRFGGGLADYQATVLADGPIVYYRLGEASGTTMLDSSGNSGRDGTYTSVTLGSPGLLVGDSNTCADFNGTSSYSTIAPASWMNATTISIEAWITPDNVSSVRSIWDRDPGPGGTRCYQFRLESNGKLGFIFWLSGGGPYTLTGNTVLVAGNTYHVVATYDGTTAKLYVNGVLDGSLSQSGTFQTSLIVGTTIGVNSSSGLNAFFDGRIDEAAFYGTVLSSDRITAHFVAGVNSGGNYLTHVLMKSPRGVWLQGEASGTTMLDSSGNSRNGTYVNSPGLNQTGILPTDPGKSVAYNGTNHYATVANAAWMIPNAFSAEVWFKTSSLPGGDHDIFVNAHNALTSRWMIRQNGGTLYFYTWSGSSWDPISAAISANTLYHVVATYDGRVADGGTGIKRLWLNKVNAASSGTGVTVATVSTVTAGIGVAGLQSGSEFFGGNVQAAALYASALSGTEIADNYDAA